MNKGYDMTKINEINNTITKELQHQKDFMRYQSNWIRYIKQNINKGNKTFVHFAVDDTQIPCLLIMNFIAYVREELNEEDYESFKNFTYDLLQNNFPKCKPFLRVVK